MIKKFRNSNDLGYKQTQFHNEPTKAYFLPMKQITNIIKSKKHIWLRTKEVKTDVNETKHANKPIGNVNKTIQYIINSMNGKKLESINVTHMCDNEVNK